jgi:hypothetical protein
MLQLVDGPPNVLVVRALGKLTKSDYEQVLDPAVKKMLDDRGEIRAVIAIGDDFDGLTPGAAWDDLRIGTAHLTKWKRCAVVSDKDWVRHGMAIFGWMMPGDVEVFPGDQLQQATDWAAA